eukprot:SM004164S15629  [mRNA]  locus=s4164:354:934:- [translate_table: standard]
MRMQRRWRHRRRPKSPARRRVLPRPSPRQQRPLRPSSGCTPCATTTSSGRWRRSPTPRRQLPEPPPSASP